MPPFRSFFSIPHVLILLLWVEPTTAWLPSAASGQRRMIHHPSSTTTTAHWATPNDDTKQPQIRFSGLDLDRQRYNQSPVDILFAGLTSDVVSIAVGTLGVVALLVGRLVLDGGSTDESDSITNNIDAMGQATRTNLLAVFATGAVLLNGVSKLDIQSALAEKVRLTGVAVNTPRVWTDPTLHGNLPWTLESLRTASPASSVIVLQSESPSEPWQVTACAGIVPPALAIHETPLSLPMEATPILDRLRSADTETYLPTLQALPGRVEFLSYLPSNTQAVLLVPVVADPAATHGRSVLALGANQARSFTPRDIAWCQTIAQRLASTGSVSQG